jgi:hypothetical protein
MKARSTTILPRPSSAALQLSAVNCTLNELCAVRMLEAEIADADMVRLCDAYTERYIRKIARPRVARETV